MQAPTEHLCTSSLLCCSQIGTLREDVGVAQVLALGLSFGSYGLRVSAFIFKAQKFGFSVYAFLIWQELYLEESASALLTM